MNKFNLTFNGEILSGKDPKRTKLRFGELFGIDDPVRLAHYFSGETIVLRGNLDRKSAAELYSKLKKMGVATELVRVTPKQTPATAGKTSTSAKSTDPGPAHSFSQEEQRTTPSTGRVGQSWAVSSRRRSRKMSDRQIKKAAGSKRTTPAEERQAAEKTAKRETELAVSQARKSKESAAQQAARKEAKRQAAEDRRKKTEEAKRRAAENKRKKAEEAKRQAAEDKRKKAEEAKRQAAEDKRKKAEEAKRQAAEDKRKKAEEAARQKALAEEAKRRAAEDKRKKAEEAARQKALADEAKRRAAEEKRKKAEEAARQQALAEEAKRRAAEDKRKKAEEAARQQALAEEAKRRAAEDKRKKAEEAARQQALAEEAKRRAAEDKRKKAEEAARQKALAEKAQRRAAEDKRKKAEEAARQQALAEEAAKREAENTERKRREAEQAARQKTLQEGVERQARQEEQRREVAANASRVKAEQQHKQADELAELEARVRAGAIRKRDEQARGPRVAVVKASAEKARLSAVREEQVAQRKAMEDMAVQRAAQELTRDPSLKPVQARIRTKLEIPPGKTDPATNPPATATRGRNRSGAPNLYSLRPFRITPEIKARAKLSRARFRRDSVITGLALACLFIAGGYYLSRPPMIEVTGADSVALAPRSGPVLLAGNHLLLHDRAGVGTDSMALRELGLHDLAGPMTFNARGELLALGHLDSAAKASAEHATRTLLRCNLQDRRCLTFSSDLAQANIASFVIHPHTGEIFLADAQAGQLLKASSDGALVRTVDTAIAQHPVVHVESGLLFMNSANGPAIRVLRYDDKAFGEQLDEILLLPEPAVVAEQTRVWDFVRTEEVWWVTLYNPDTNSPGVYRFDEQWNYLDRIELAPGTRPEQLVSWGQRTLVRDPRRVPIQRFNAQGSPETPLDSDLLQKLVTGQQRTAKIKGLAWQTGLVFLALISVAGIFLVNLHRIRTLVYRSHRERGAEPIDEQISAVQWVAPVPERAAKLRRNGAAYAALALLLLSLAIIQRVSLVELVALLFALGGPAIALVLLRKSPVGHIGILDGQLLLADHTGMYQLGRDARLQYRSPFLLLDDVVVFTGTRLLPAFSPEQIAGEVATLASAGIKVDRKTVMIKLLQYQHPLARGAIAIGIGLVLAVTLLALPL